MVGYEVDDIIGIFVKMVEKVGYKVDVFLFDYDFL